MGTCVGGQQYPFLPCFQTEPGRNVFLCRTYILIQCDYWPSWCVKLCIVQHSISGTYSNGGCVCILCVQCRGLREVLQFFSNNGDVKVWRCLQLPPCQAAQKLQHRTKVFNQIGLKNLSCTNGLSNNRPHVNKIVFTQFKLDSN